ncbi:hypothetical protein BDY24DRAFT_148702 [Mrakia frigida]|uniref:uncharacterized protein n=1 Tax=Mrakia frigida TaxID=29902 RepID=UPI003FCC0B9A
MGGPSAVKARARAQLAQNLSKIRRQVPSSAPPPSSSLPSPPPPSFLDLNPPPPPLQRISELLDLELQLQRVGIETSRTLESKRILSLLQSQLESKLLATQACIDSNIDKLQRSLSVSFFPSPPFASILLLRSSLELFSLDQGLVLGPSDRDFIDASLTVSLLPLLLAC